MYIPGTTCFAHSSCTSLFILIFIKSTVDCIAHFILFHCTLYSLFIFIFFNFFYLTLTYIYIYSLVLCFIFYFTFLHCPLSGPVLTYISLLIIPCMIVYVTNNKEPWRTLNLELEKTIICFHNTEKIIFYIVLNSLNLSSMQIILQCLSNFQGDDIVLSVVIFVDLLNYLILIGSSWK